MYVSDGVAVVRAHQPAVVAWRAEWCGPRRSQRLIDSAGGRAAAAGNSGIVKTGARTRVFRATQHAICARSPRRIISYARAQHRWQFRISKSPRDCSERCSVALPPAVVFTRFVPVITWNLRLEWKRWPRRGYRRSSIMLTVRPMRWFCVCFSSAGYSWMQFFVWNSVECLAQFFRESPCSLFIRVWRWRPR